MTQGPICAPPRISGAAVGAGFIARGLGSASPRPAVAYA